MPHVTLKSIANNPDIKEGMSREQIDKAIAKHGESETLYEDKGIVRVTGPFTVETLSPHRSLPFDPPESGKIAVKVINHYGDKVLKVFSLENG
jgi:adenine-specific DNA-methyltransferase